MSALVSPKSVFRSAYAFYLQEPIGYLLGAYLVEASPTGAWTLTFQRLRPENFSQFAHSLDETDKKLAQLLSEIIPQALFKQFGGKIATLTLFLEKFDKHPHQAFMREYIDRRMQTALPLLATRHIFQATKDGYPAGQPVEFMDKELQPDFHFVRQAEHTDYTLRLSLDGKPLQLKEENSCVVADQPAWVVHKGGLYRVTTDVEGKKIAPFLRKPHLTIPAASEPAFYEKFLVKLIEKYPVTTEGLDIRYLDVAPQFKLRVTKDKLHIYAFRLLAVYGPFETSLSHVQPCLSRYLADDGPAFEVVRRDLAKEQEKTDFFATLREGEPQLFDFSLNEQRSLAWLSRNYEALVEQDIALDLGNLKLNFTRPTLHHEVVEFDDYLVLNFYARADGATIRTAQLAKNIRARDHKLPLPDGTFALVPELWIDELTPLLEAGDLKAEGLRLQPCHKALIESLFNATLTERKLNQFERIEAQIIPDALQALLRDYQIHGFEWLCFLQDFQLGGVLADDMGLGKTVQTLTLLLREQERRAGPTLIVAPSSLIFNWIDEINRFAPSLKHFAYIGQKRDTARLMEYDVVLTTYGTVRQDAEKLGAYYFHYVILDESHVIKNRESQTTRAVLQLKGRHRLSLTGTPIENSTRDLWTQMEFLNPGLLGSKKFFEQYYATPIEKEGNAKRKEQLARQVQPLILRRTKEMVAKELPEMRRQIIHCEMTPGQRKMYNNTRLQYRNSLFDDEGQEGPQSRMKIFTYLQRLRQIALHPQMLDPEAQDSGKYDMLRHHLNVALSSGSKVLVFSQFVKFLSIMRKDLTQEGVPFCYLDGSTTDRAGEVRHFQNDPAFKVFLISLKAGGVGLNLTAAEYVFLVDPWWNPAIELQAEARAHRIGQHHPVCSYKLITRHSIEEKIVRLQQSKAQIADDIVRSDQGFIKSLTREDLLFLFD